MPRCVFAFARQGRFFNDSEGVRQAAESVSHADLGWFFFRYVAGTGEIPWDDFFRSVGLRVVAVSNSVADAGFTASHNFDGPMSVNSVSPASDAERAGLQVGDIIVELLGVDPGEVKVDSRFREDLKADSLDLVELIMAIEEEFGGEISDEEAQKITTVNEAVTYIDTRMQPSK